MHPTRSLLVSTAIVFAGIVAANAVYDWYCHRHYVPALTLSRALKGGDECVVTLGDSRMAAGIDGTVLAESLASRSGKPCVALLGVGALGISGQKMVLDKYLNAPRRPRTVVLGTSMGGILPARAADPSELVGNRALELGWSTTDDWFTYYRGELPQRFDETIRFGLNRAGALSSYASLTWFKAQRLQDRLAGNDAARPANHFGALSDMQRLAVGFAKGDRAALERFDGRFETSVWFDEIRALAEAGGATLVVVHVPMHSSYRNEVLGSDAARRYEEWISRELTEQGARYVDLSSLAPDEMFSDGLHLGRAGAGLFSRALGDRLE
jgi:hypothetical protein